MQVGIVGFGRFGQLLGQILEKEFSVIHFDTDSPLEPLKNCQTVFLCVPIRAFSNCLEYIKPHLDPGATVIDTCSVKCYPVQQMQEKLSNTQSIIATHPLFGPDSFHEAHNNHMMIYPVQHADASYPFWSNYFAKQNIQMIEMTPDKHDQYAARSQGITHLLGRTLEKMGIEPTPIDTLGFERLLGIMNQTCNDSLELFYDLQHYNPYTKPLIQELIASLQKLKTELSNK